MKRPSGKSPMRRRAYEGSATDVREDRKGAKALGLTAAQYERTERDRREDAAGAKRQRRPR